jgi:hypothetical protein
LRYHCDLILLLLPSLLVPPGSNVDISVLATESHL